MKRGEMIMMTGKERREGGKGEMMTGREGKK